MSFAYSLARGYARRNYKRIGRAAMGMAVRRYRRTYTTRTRHLRGTSRRRIGGPMPKKRSWGQAMGVTNAPSARTRIRKSRFNANLGLAPGSRSSRRCRYEESDSGTSDKTLRAVPMIFAQYSDTDTRMDVRNGRIANVSGVKMRMWMQIKNQATNTNKFDNPIQVRWAIVNPLKQTTGTVLDVTLGINFFVSDLPTADDAANFPNTGNCFKYMNRKINKRAYGVLQEGTFVLANDTSSTETRMDIKSKKFLSTYIPVGRQIKWGSNGTSTAQSFPLTNVYFVYWYCQQGHRDDFLVFPTANDAPMDMDMETITYFRTPDKLG